MIGEVRHSTVDGNDYGSTSFDHKSKETLPRQPEFNRTQNLFYVKGSLRRHGYQTTTGFQIEKRPSSPFVRLSTAALPKKAVQKQYDLNGRHVKNGESRKKEEDNQTRNAISTNIRHRRTKGSLDGDIAVGTDASFWPKEGTLTNSWVEQARGSRKLLSDEQNRTLYSKEISLRGPETIHRMKQDGQWRVNSDLSGVMRRYKDKVLKEKLFEGGKGYYSILGAGNGCQDKLLFEAAKEVFRPKKIILSQCVFHKNKEQKKSKFLVDPKQFLKNGTNSKNLNSVNEAERERLARTFMRVQEEYLRFRRQFSSETRERNDEHGVSDFSNTDLMVKPPPNSKASILRNDWSKGERPSSFFQIKKKKPEQEKLLDHTITAWESPEVYDSSRCFM